MTDKELFDLLIESSSLRPDLLEEAKKLWGGAIKMKICDIKITLRQFLKLPFGVKGAVAIWPAGSWKNIGDQYDHIVEFDSVDDEGIENYLDYCILQIFPDSNRRLNFVLYGEKQQ